MYQELWYWLFDNGQDAALAAALIAISGTIIGFSAGRIVEAKQKAELTATGRWTKGGGRK